MTLSHKPWLVLTGMLLLALPAFAAEQTGSIKGIVVNAENGSRIAGARISIAETQLTATTRRDGGFILTGLVFGSYAIEAHADDFTEARSQVKLSAEKPVANVRIEMRKFTYSEEVVVVPPPPPPINQQPEVSTVEVQPEEIAKMAGSLRDLNRVIQTMPGVVSDNDFSSLLYVRGGDIVETMSILDRCYIMNPYHMGGLTTIFNPDIIDTVNFSAGGFPANYPNALSGIIDINYRDGNMSTFAGGIDASMIDTNLRLEGPLADHEASYLIAGRRTYYDLVLNSIKTDGATVVPYYGDLFGKVSWQLSPGHKLTYEILGSEDSLKLRNLKELARGANEKPGNVFYKDDTYLSTLNYSGLPAPGWLLKSTLSYTFLKVMSDITGSDSMAIDGKIGFTQLYSDVVYQAGSRHEFDLGIQLTRMDFTLDSLLLDWRFETSSARRPGYENLPELQLDFNHDLSMYYGVFLQDRWQIVTDKLIAQLGVRSDTWNRNHETTTSPRVQMTYNLNQNHSLKFATGLYQELPMNILYLHKTWGNPELKSERSMHYILGWEWRTSRNTNLRVETYYKDLSHLIANYDDPAFALSEHLKGKPWFDNVERGFSYGVELFYQLRPAHKLDGWITYGYAVTKRYNPLFTQNSKWFYPLQDQRHTLSFIANYAASRKWYFSGKFTVTTGKPYTDVLAWKTEPDNPDDPNSSLVWVVDQYGGLDAKRFPIYHKLDLKVERVFVQDTWEFAWHLDLLNAYDQKNPYDFDYDNGLPPNKLPKRETIYGLPLIPFTGIDITF